MSTPANHTFQELRGRVTKQIERITNPSQPRQAAALLAALTKEHTLESLASTEAQRERYKVITGRSWEQDFMSVREVRFMTIGGLTGNRLVENLWHQLPDSRFKRFQELFCAPENWLLPRVSDGATGVSFLSAPELNTCSVHPCLVSPDRLPSKLLQDLGLITWPDPTPDPIETLRLKSAPAVIEGIKAIFDATRSIKVGNQRVRVIEHPTTGEGTLYPNAAPVSPRIIGSLLYIRDDGGGDAKSSTKSVEPWRPPHRIVSFYEESYSTTRKTLRQTASYDKELGAVRVLIEEWKALNGKIEAQWKKDASAEVKTALRGELGSLAARSREHLSKATNQQKREADEIIQKVDEALRGDGKNIGAMMARMVAVWNRLERRMNAIPRKSGFNECDRMQLNDSKTLMHTRFQRVLEALPNAASILAGEIGRHQGMFNTRFVDEPAKRAAAQSVLRRMYIPAESLKNTSIRPFVAFAELILEAYDDLSAAVVNQNAAEARKALVRITIGSKLQRANRIFEELKEYTSAGTTVPLEKLTTTAVKLRDLLNAQAIFPRTQVPEFNDLYKRVSEKANHIARGLEAYSRRGLDLSERAAMYENLRRFLDDEPRNGSTGTAAHQPLDIEAAALGLLKPRP